MENNPEEKSLFVTSDSESVQPDLFASVKASKRVAPWLPVDGRDELNLAEFPLAALSSRITPGQKTLVFKDCVWDSQARQKVERQLTVMAADKFGLPNALDDEVILALIQLSKRQGFTSKTVPFSRYEIIQVLGWEDESWNYRRIIQALDRWTSVTLKYENAWWEPTSKSWVDETFHIIERLTEVKDEHGKERAAFVWSDVIFQNFESGNLKSLDLDVYRRLNTPAAKRLYRLLDKRFYRHRKVEFDLIDLAYHKLGISQNYLIGNIKQRLQPAIEELEAVGFIKPAAKERYKKLGVGKWHIIFERASEGKLNPGETPLPLQEESFSEVEALLIEFGVTPTIARRLVITQPDGYLREKIDVMRHLKANKTVEIKNPGGFLVKSIEEKYAAPEDYKPPAEVAKIQAAVEQNKAARREAAAKKKEQENQKQIDDQRQAAAQTERVGVYLASLTSTQAAEIRGNAYQRERNRGEPFSRWIDEKTPIGEMFRKQVVEDAVLEILEKHKIPPS